MEKCKYPPCETESETTFCGSHNDQLPSVLVHALAVLRPTQYQVIYWSIIGQCINVLDEA